MSRMHIRARYEQPMHYVLSEVELDRLKELSNLPEREWCFFAFGLLLPALVNALSKFPKDQQPLSAELFWNAIVAVPCLLLCAFFGVRWYNKRNSYDAFVETLKDRPEGRIAVSSVPAASFATPPPPAPVPVSISAQEAAS